MPPMSRAPAVRLPATGEPTWIPRVAGMVAACWKESAPPSRRILSATVASGAIPRPATVAAWALAAVETCRTPSLTVRAPLPMRARLAALLPERMRVERPVLVRAPEPETTPEKVWALTVMPVVVGTIERVSRVRLALPRLIGPEKVWLTVPYWPRRREVTPVPTKIGLAIVGAFELQAVRVELPEMKSGPVPREALLRRIRLPCCRKVPPA